METLTYSRLNEILMEQYEEEVKKKKEKQQKEGKMIDKIVNYINAPTSENLGGIVGEGISNIRRQNAEVEIARRKEDEDRTKYVYISNNYI